MYKIAICEDDQEYIEVIKKLIVKTNVVDVNMLLFQEFCSGEQLSFHPQLDFDLIIMDIQMGKMDGYETAMELRKIDNNFLLVFCSGVIMPTPKFFRANAFRYLDKNDSAEELLSEMTVIMNEMVARKDRPFIMYKYSLAKEQIRVYPESVLYISIRQSGSQAHVYGKLKDMFPTEVLRNRMSVNAVSEIFDESQGFVRLHNSYIVNMAYITKVLPESVELIDGTILNVSRSKVKQFQQAFARYVALKYEG